MNPFQSPTFVFLSKALSDGGRARSVEKPRQFSGIILASPAGVSELTSRWEFDEPTVMWRMSRADGQSSHAVIDARPDGAAVIWYVNDRPLGARDFSDWTIALRWCDQMQAQNWAAGWRLASE